MIEFKVSESILQLMILLFKVFGGTLNLLKLLALELIYSNNSFFISIILFLYFILKLYFYYLTIFFFINHFNVRR
jgi:hypothetical protein